MGLGDGALRSKVSSLLSCQYPEGGLRQARLLEGRGGSGRVGTLKVAACGWSSLIWRTQDRIVSP